MKVNFDCLVLFLNLKLEKAQSQGLPVNPSPTEGKFSLADTSALLTNSYTVKCRSHFEARIWKSSHATIMLQAKDVIMGSASRQV